MTETTTTPRPGIRGSLLRGTSGVTAASLVVLLLIVVGAQIYFQFSGYPGIGWPTVGGHLLAAALAVFAQRVADRRTGAVSALASLAVLVIVAATLWWFWWA